MIAFCNASARWSLRVALLSAAAIGGSAPQLAAQEREMAPSASRQIQRLL